MRAWGYLIAILAALGIVALIITDNRVDGETVAPQADNSSAELAAGSFQAAIGVLSPITSIQMLIAGGALPAEAEQPLNDAANQYQQALSLPPAEAATLLEQSLASLDSAQAFVEDAAVDASNQVSQEALKRSATAIGAIESAVEADLALLHQTGSPVPSVIVEGEEK